MIISKKPIKDFSESAPVQADADVNQESHKFKNMNKKINEIESQIRFVSQTSNDRKLKIDEMYHNTLLNKESIEKIKKESSKQNDELKEFFQKIEKNINQSMWINAIFTITMGLAVVIVLF